jgi:hypothetical protein
MQAELGAGVEILRIQEDLALEAGEALRDGAQQGLVFGFGEERRRGGAGGEERPAVERKHVHSFTQNERARSHQRDFPTGLRGELE